MAGLDALLDADPDRADALALRGLLRRLLGDPEAAMADLDRAVAVDATDPFAMHQRALALRTLGDVDAAMAAFRTALDIGFDPDEVRRTLREAGYIGADSDMAGNGALSSSELAALAAWIAGDPPRSDPEPE